MQIKSPLFGSAEISEDKIIEFPKGLPGFDHCRRFTLLHEEGREAHVFLLQSVDEPDVAFSVTAPERLGLPREPHQRRDYQERVDQAHAAPSFCALHAFAISSSFARSTGP